MQRIFHRIIFTGLWFGVSVFLFILIINLYFQQVAKNYIYSDINKIPSVYTALIPGSLVYGDSSLSLIVRDRVDKAIELYKAGKINRFLVSGDHGTKKYDEVNCMKRYLKEQGIPEEDIFLDHAGFDTYSSIVRAEKVFDVKDMIIVSQDYHLQRALYIAHKKGIIAYGFIADKRKYPGMRIFQLREYLANVKAFFFVLFNLSPRFLGPEIPISGDSKLSYD
jgi:SanA protein